MFEPINHWRVLLQSTILSLLCIIGWKFEYYLKFHSPSILSDRSAHVHEERDRKIEKKTHIFCTNDTTFSLNMHMFLNGCLKKHRKWHTQLRKNTLESDIRKSHARIHTHTWQTQQMRYNVFWCQVQHQFQTLFVLDSIALFTIRIRKMYISVISKWFDLFTLEQHVENVYIYRVCSRKRVI